MKTVMLIVVGVIGTILFLGLIAYAVGATLPVDHIVSVTGTVAAPPAKVFAVITDVADGPTWRPEVKSVQVGPAATSVMTAKTFAGGAATVPVMETMWSTGSVAPTAKAMRPRKRIVPTTPTTMSMTVFIRLQIL